MTEERITAVVVDAVAGSVDAAAVRAALPGLDVTVAEEGTEDMRHGDCVVVTAAAEAERLLAASGEPTRPWVVLVTDDKRASPDHERVRYHPTNALATLETRVVDAVLADRERQRMATESKPFRERLFENGIAYRTLVENLPGAGVSLFDRDLRYLSVGGGVFEIVDLDPDDVEGRLVTDVHSERFVERHREKYEAVFDGERSSFEFAFDGHEFVSDLLPIYDGDDVVAGMVMTRDVTAERERERELLTKTQAMDSAAIGLCLTDPTQEDNPLVYVNQGYQEMTGYDADEVLGKNPRHLQGPKTEREPNDRMREAVANAEPCAVDITNYRKDGTPFVNHVEITPIFDDEGDLVHFLGSQVDVTEQHERERALAMQNEQLEEFAGIVSHDLRGPIAVAQGRVGLAQKTEDHSHLEPVGRVLDRMQELVDDLLTLAREGRQLDTERVELVSIERVAREAWGTANTGNARLVVTDDVEVQADENRLRQLFENCLRNSIQHGVAADAEPAALTVRVGPLADDAGFFIEDDGVGLPDSLDDAFEAGATTAEDGTGFGLAIVRTVAEAHGWSVAVTASEEGGARFEFRT